MASEEYTFLSDMPRALKKVPTKQVNSRPVYDINKADKEEDLFDIGKSPAKLKTKNLDPFGDDLINMDDFGDKPVKQKVAKKAPRPKLSPPAGANEELFIRSNKKAAKKSTKLSAPFKDDPVDFGENKSVKKNIPTLPRSAMEELGISPGGKNQPKASKKAPKKDKTEGGDYKSYSKDNNNFMYMTQQGYDKQEIEDMGGEKFGGRPGRGKMKTQGMNKTAKRKAGFSGKGSGAALRGF